MIIRIVLTAATVSSDIGYPARRYRDMSDDSDVLSSMQLSQAALCFWSSRLRR
jgi:hypothetical protein